MAEIKTPVVLVADDEPSMLALVSAFVRSKGYTVVEASDGDMAWQLACERLPDLIILDVMMPGMSGWEVCRKVREAVSLAHTGVIMLTGIGESLNEMTSPLYGADAHVDKPFEFGDLERTIIETLKKRRGGALGRTELAAVGPPSDRATVRSPDFDDEWEAPPTSRSPQATGAKQKRAAAAPGRAASKAKKVASKKAKKAGPKAAGKKTASKSRKAPSKKAATKKKAIAASKKARKPARKAASKAKAKTKAKTKPARKKR